MSDYDCFNCNETTHTSDLVRVEWRGLVSLLCPKCIEKIFIKNDEEPQEDEINMEKPEKSVSSLTILEESK